MALDYEIKHGVGDLVFATFDADILLGRVKEIVIREDVRYRCELIAPLYRADTGFERGNDKVYTSLDEAQKVAMEYIEKSCKKRWAEVGEAWKKEMMKGAEE